jgi:DNA helicase-2/ATP-dependent DNA helicase PcrA
MHSAKGLEYDTVFIIDANEEITPHKKAITAEEIEEERRMFYVAMTRAKNNLKIMYAKERYNKELEVSRFVREIIGEEYRNELYQEHNL